MGRSLRKTSSLSLSLSRSLLLPCSRHAKIKLPSRSRSWSSRSKARLCLGDYTAEHGWQPAQTSIAGEGRDKPRETTRKYKSSGLKDWRSDKQFEERFTSSLGAPRFTAAAAAPRVGHPVRPGGLTLWSLPRSPALHRPNRKPKPLIRD